MRILIVFLTLFVSSELLSQEEHYIKDGKNLIHLTTYGEGEPILIINGGPGMSSKGYHSLAEKLGEKNLAIIYDQRGTGQSKSEKVDASTITMKGMLDDIEKIRMYLKVDKWVVLGHSFGGMLASHYTSHYPERTKGLILSSSGGVDMELISNLDITARLTQKDKDSLFYWTLKIAQGDTTYNAKLQRGTYLASAYLNDKSHMPKVAKRLAQTNMEINGLVFRDMRKIGFDCKPILAKYTKPVLVIQGAHDIIPLELGEKAHELFSNSTFVILEKSAHFGWLEESELYLKSIQELLQKTAS
jgi:proline iminopeptidase